MVGVQGPLIPYLSGYRCGLSSSRSTRLVDFLNTRNGGLADEPNDPDNAEAKSLPHRLQHRNTNRLDLINAFCKRLIHLGAELANLYEPQQIPYLVLGAT